MFARQDPTIHDHADGEEDAHADHLLYILLDSNLPTGGFVASSGLESYAKHGFLKRPLDKGTTTTTNAAASDGLVHYVQESVRNYSASTVPFVRDSWELLPRTTRQDDQGLNDHEDTTGDEDADEETTIHRMVSQIQRLDALYDAVTLNHVTRRSSTAQGIALLTLYTKAFADPSSVEDDDKSSSARKRREQKRRGTRVIERIKKMIRRGETAGHLPVCWGLMTSAAGLSLGTSSHLLPLFSWHSHLQSTNHQHHPRPLVEKTIHLHLFLHIRSVLSAAVRLNIVGPYASTALLYRSLRGWLEQEVRGALVVRLGTGLGCAGGGGGGGVGDRVDQLDLGMEKAGEDEDDWSWADETEQQVLNHLHNHNHNRIQQHLQTEPSTATTTQIDTCRRHGWTGPTMVWPLGEIIMARHDFQHTRIFNS